MLFRRLRTFSPNHDHYLASIVLKSWHIVQDVQTIQSDMPEVSLHWTWFEFGKLILKQHTLRLQYAKEYVIQFYKMINVLYCNLSFARKYIYIFTEVKGFRGLNKNKTFVEFKLRNQNFHLHYSYTKSLFSWFWYMCIVPLTTTTNIVQLL